MRMETPEKVGIAVAVGIMGFALLGIVVIGVSSGVYLFVTNPVAQLEPPPPPLLPSVPILPSSPSAPATAEPRVAAVGLWVRTDDSSNDIAMFAPIESERYGVFHSSIDGEGAWFTGRNGVLFMVTRENGISQWRVTFPTASTMTIQGPNESQTWRKIASLT